MGQALGGSLARAEGAFGPRSAYGLNPRYVGVPGRDWARPEMSRQPEATVTYMTASEMQAEVAGITGYAHPAFDKYADVLGKYDPATGARTTDKPTLLAILFMQQIALSVADYVIEREMFLDDDERVVFAHVDLATSPADAALDTFLDALHTRWLDLPVGPQTLAVLHGQFRQIEAAHGTPAAYGRVLALLLQHGGLYYY
jgi:hypothetical protein